MIPKAYVSMSGAGSRVEGLNARRDPPRELSALKFPILATRRYEKPPRPCAAGGRQTSIRRGV